MTDLGLFEIVSTLGVRVLRTMGDLNTVVKNPAPITTAGRGEITFHNGEGEQLRKVLQTSSASAVICKEIEWSEEFQPALIVVEDPRMAFVELMQHYFVVPEPTGIDPSASIGRNVSLAENIHIGAFVSIGERCTVGRGTVIHPNVSIYANTRIGEGVVIHANTVIGAAGFGYGRNSEGELIHFPHIGGVVIEDGVEIGSNVSIDRGTLGDTVIRKGAKIDNLTHIAHNVDIGESACVIAMSMVGGSTAIGARSWISPSTCLRDGIVVGDDALVGLGAVVVKNVEPGAVVMGAPAKPEKEFKARLKAVRELVERQNE